VQILHVRQRQEKVPSRNRPYNHLNSRVESLPCQMVLPGGIFGEKAEKHFFPNTFLLTNALHYATIKHNIRGVLKMTKLLFAAEYFYFYFTSFWGKVNLSFTASRYRYLI